MTAPPRRNPVPAPRVSVVVVNYRTPDLTAQAAASARIERAPEVIVVDNGSGDDSVDALRSLVSGSIQLVESHVNGGFARGANLGACRASGDVLVFLNSDARLQPRSLMRLTDAVTASGGRAIIGPRLVEPDGTVQRSAGLVPKPLDLVIRGLGLNRVAKVAGRVAGLQRLIDRQPMAAEYALAETAQTPVDVSMVSGACLAVGREAFVELGGFDERYFMYFEDADLCRRASRAGWPIRYLPEAHVEHIGGASTGVDYRFGPWHAASMVRYLRDWHGLSGVAAALAVLWLRAIGHALTLRPNTRRAFEALGAGLATAVKRD